MKKSLEDYTRVMRGRYARRTGKGARSALLNEYCSATGLESKYANKVLRAQRRLGSSGVPRGAYRCYAEGDIEVLKSVWLSSGQPCGKRFAGEMLEQWLRSWERHHQRSLSKAQRTRLLGISAAQRS